MPNADDFDDDDWDFSDGDYDDDPADMADPPDMGACCACGTTGPTVRNIIMLNKRSPTGDKGWGCLVCGLPGAGALAVVCDACMESQAEIVRVIFGYATGGDRVPIGTLIDEPFDHDLSKHPELEQ